MATITGSTTMWRAPYCRSFWAMTEISSAEDTMPILTASGKISVNTASSCAERNAGVESKMSVTPVVFWAVRAVTAVMAYTPLADMVLISAWIPAPPLESLPAMDNAVLIGLLLSCFSITFIERRKVVPPICRLKVPATGRDDLPGFRGSPALLPYRAGRRRPAGDRPPS